MTDGLCYTFSNSDTIYAYPALSCTDGDPVPSSSSTTRQSWIYDKVSQKYTLSSVVSNASVNSNYGTSLSIAHIYHTPHWYDSISSDILLICSLVVVGCLFKLILNMFMGVRR